MTNEPQQVLDKRTRDDRIYDVLLVGFLDPEEYVTQMVTPTAIIVDNQIPSAVDLTFGVPVINAAPIYYPDYLIWAQIGQALQVEIIGGSIPAGAPNYQYTIHFLVVTNLNRVLDATVLLNMTDSAP